METFTGYIVLLVYVRPTHCIYFVTGFSKTGHLAETILTCVAEIHAFELHVRKRI